MDRSTASRTAMGAALMRAIHTRRDPAPLLCDPWGDQLVPGAMIDGLRRILAGSAHAVSAASPSLAGAEHIGTSDRDRGAEAGLAAQGTDIVQAWLHASQAYAGVILRSRYTEDALSSAISRGVRQYVLVGAGFDSFALRIPKEAQGLRIFEVDHPATQEFKRQRLRDCRIELPDSVRLLPADLANDPLDDVLRRSEFDFSTPAFFSWLGVTVYLTKEANLATFERIAACGAPGSALVFTYLDHSAFPKAGAAAPAQESTLQRSVAALGEPFRCGFEPRALRAELLSLGLRIEEDLSDVDLVERYDPQKLNGLVPAFVSRIALAHVFEPRSLPMIL